MTLADFAGAIQTDLSGLRNDMNAGFREIREDMATKNELQTMKREMDGSFRDLRADVKTITEVMVSKADLANTLREELDKSPYATQKELEGLRTDMRRVDDLQVRIATVELQIQKLSMGKKDEQASPRGKVRF